jgi:cellulose 1,4-beta-cellobiosidase
MNVRAVVATAGMLLAAAGVVALPAGVAHAAVACEVEYRKTFDNGRQFGATLTISNLGEAVNGWTLGFGFDAGQRVTRGWSATWSQRGATVTARSLPWNARLDTGATATIGFTGSHRGANPDPTAFTLNGVPCTGAPPTPVELVLSAATLSVPEGASAAFLVRLSAAPSAPVTVAATAGAGDTDLTVIAGGALMFTPTDWDAPQEVRVAAAEDADATNGTRQVTVSAPGILPVTVVATEQDDELSPPEPPVIVVPTVLTVPEGGSSTFTLRMGSAPAGHHHHHHRGRWRRPGPARVLGHHSRLHPGHLDHPAVRDDLRGRGRRHAQRLAHVHVRRVRADLVLGDRHGGRQRHRPTASARPAPRHRKQGGHPRGVLGIAFAASV